MGGLLLGQRGDGFLEIVDLLFRRITKTAFDLRDSRLAHTPQPSEFFLRKSRLNPQCANFLSHAHLNHSFLAVQAQEPVPVPARAPETEENPNMGNSCLLVSVVFWECEAF